MIPRKAKFLSALLEDINSKSVNVNPVIQNTPINVEVLEVGSKFKVTDGYSTISCKFLKKAVFWFKMKNDNKDISELKGEYLTLIEYNFGSILRAQGQLEVFLEIHSFIFLPKGETNPISKIPKDILQDPNIRHSIEALKIYHIREALSKMPMEIPNLEEILGVKTVKKSKKEIKPPISDLEDKNEKKRGGKDEIIEPENLKSVEKEISKDVEAIFEQDKKKKSKVKGGSEENIEADTMLSKMQKLIKDKSIVEMLKDSGFFTKRRITSKGPPKKTAVKLEKIVEIINEDNKEKKELKKKRKASGEKDVNKKPEKRRAIEVEGKKVSSKVKRDSRSPKTTKVKSHK